MYTQARKNKHNFLFIYKYMADAAGKGLNCDGSSGFSYWLLDFSEAYSRYNWLIYLLQVIAIAYFTW